MDNQDKKRQMIIEAATKRFAHFGISKTTMTEIAKDLSLSKALLYYYFPDKLSLYIAVMEYVASSMISQIESGATKIEKIEDIFFFMIDKRLDFFKQYHNLLDYQSPSQLLRNKDSKGVIDRIKLQEKRLIVSFFNYGLKKGELKMDDPDYLADLLIFSLKGMAFSVLSPADDCFVPTKPDMDEIARRQKSIIRIFLKGVQA